MQRHGWEVSGPAPLCFHSFDSTLLGVATDAHSMHAWIFRHRKRLSAVFGIVSGEAWEYAPEDEQGSSEPARPVKPLPRCHNRLGIPPGGFARRGRYVVMAPMARRKSG